MIRNTLPVALAAALLLGGAPAEAQARLAATRLDQFNKQTALMDRRLAGQYAHSKRLQPVVPRTVAVAREAIPRYDGSRRSAWVDTARAAARRHGIPEDLFLRLVRQESGWNPRARSHKGALGLAQLMPATARRLGVDPHDPAQNLDGGARYLATQYRKFGTWRLALAAYNAGPGAVLKYGDIPPYRETRTYVSRILGRG